MGSLLPAQGPQVVQVAGRVETADSLPISQGGDSSSQGAARLPDRLS